MIETGSTLRGPESAGALGEVSVVSREAPRLWIYRKGLERHPSKDPGCRSDVAIFHLAVTLAAISCSLVFLLYRDERTGFACDEKMSVLTAGQVCSYSTTPS